MHSLRNKLFSVMTWNIYQGFDATPIFTATPEQIPERVTEVFRQFLATNFTKRARAIARQILLEKPDIIGLQEAVLVKLIPPNSHMVVYDFVDILINELACSGIEYSVAAKNQNVSIELPSSSGNKVSFTDHDVILVRKECSIKVINKKEANFKENLQVKIGNQQFTILRGWSYIDAFVHGHMFRIVNTHLEPLDQLKPGLQAAQGNELLNGPGNTKLPLIFIGDFNSNANGTGTATYGNLIAAGFEDTWLVGGYGDGFTCCQDADLLNATSNLNERIDLILIKNKGTWDVEKDALVGEVQSDRTYSRLWPSDHAGIIAKFKLENH